MSLCIRGYFVASIYKSGVHAAKGAPIPFTPELEPVTVKRKDVNFVWKVVKLIKEL